MFELREKYIKQIEPFIESDLIKVITGMRRSGKSVLLNQIKDKLLSDGIGIEQVLFINFESFKYKDLYNAETLYPYFTRYTVKKCMDVKANYFQLIITYKNQYNNCPKRCENHGII